MGHDLDRQGASSTLTTSSSGPRLKQDRVRDRMRTSRPRKDEDGKGTDNAVSLSCDKLLDPVTSQREPLAPPAS